MNYMTYPIRKIQKFQEKYGYDLVVEESTGFCARMEKNGVYHFLSGSDLGINSSASQRTSADKYFTDFFLAKDGLNTIPTVKLDKKEDLKAIDFSYPLLLKPNMSQSGNGVLLVQTAEDALRAFDYVHSFSEIVLAQEYIRKREFRLVTLDGVVFFCYERLPFVIVGDGKRSISSYVDEKNASLAEQQKIDKSDFRISFNLGCQNLAVDSIPEAGQVVKIFVNANLKCGGSWEAVSGTLHPEYLAIAGRCARSLNLRVAGIDLFAGSMEEFDPNYRIIEVNSRPGFEYTKRDEELTEKFFLKVVEIIVKEYLEP